MDRRLGEHGRRIQGPGLQQRLASARGVKPTPRRVVREVVIERIVAQTGLEEFMPVEAEIGEILGCTAKAVETRNYRARRLLRVSLGRLLETV